MNAPLAADWKNAFEEIVAALPDCAQRIYGDRLKALVLFGSVARGTQRPDSDIDLLLVCEPLPPRRLLRIIEFEQLEAALSPCLEAARRRGVYTALSPILRTPAELQAGGFVLLDIPAEGRFLYDREGLARAFFARLAAWLAAQGAQRRQISGSSYWVLKPDARAGDPIALAP